MNVGLPAKFEVFSFTRPGDNGGYSKKLGSPWIRPRFLFPHFLAFVRRDPVNVSAKFALRSFTRIIAIEVLGWSYEPPILGKGTP